MDDNAVFRPVHPQVAIIGNGMRILHPSLCAALVLGVLLVQPQDATACKCAPKRAACEVLDGYTAVFVGVVTDTGPTIAALQSEFRRKLSPHEIERLENAGELSLSDAKKIWARLLPERALPALRRASTEEEVQRITIKYFPVLGEWERPVRFTVYETFQSDKVRVREVWTGQGFGDCGYDFQLGNRYLVYAYWNADAGRLVTGTCTRTREYSDATEDLKYLRSLSKGAAEGRVFGIATFDLDEFRTRSLWWANDPAKHPAAGIKISVSSETLTESMVADAQGRFEFNNLPSGTYTIGATGEGFRFPDLPQRIELKPAACSARTILAERVPLP